MVIIAPNVFITILFLKVVFLGVTNVVNLIGKNTNKEVKKNEND